MSGPDKPWTFDPSNPFIPDHGGEIRDERGKVVCFVSDAETAERIVNAVNGDTRWQPIETAPRDGSYFLASTVLTSDDYDEDDRLIRRGVKERFAVVAYFIFGDFAEYPFRNAFVQNLEFTHWQPLPKHPVQS